ncbi:hypothetical protein VNI00_006838 [Paramarasmius palmivorus]|uniref:Protein kinase domain-containing protein n=1 Tax=Paramarasmius palmivorus TaxID=297713 RepID=A0AAW0D7M1_9AGAR
MEMYVGCDSDTVETVHHHSLLLLADDALSVKDTAGLSADHSTTTYRGEDKRGSLFAVRVWREKCSELETRKRFMKRLERELLVWHNLQHANLAPLHGLTFTYGKWPASVTPYYRNGNINEYLAKHSKKDVLRLLCGVAKGLSHLHSREPPVAHGDVRGCNIFIDDDGSPVLTNIGTNHLPIPPNWIIASDDGTRWMAPEIMLSDVTISPMVAYEDSRLQVTPASDVYSFGMTILEVYTGRVPYAHKRFYGGVIHDVVNGIRPPRPDSGSSPCLTDEIWEVITSCWEQDPCRRPTIDAVLRRLRILHKTSLLKPSL